MSGDENDLDENLRAVDSIFNARTDSIQLASTELGIALDGRDLSSLARMPSAKKKKVLRPNLKLEGDITMSTIGDTNHQYKKRGSGSPNLNNISIQNSN